LGRGENRKSLSPSMAPGFPPSGRPNRDGADMAGGAPHAASDFAVSCSEAGGGRAV